MDKDFQRGLWQEGTPFIWLSGIAVLVLMGMVVGLVVLILAKGSTHFWPSRVAELTLKNGTKALGLIMEVEEIPQYESGPGGPPKTRTLLKIANRDIHGLDFKWFDAEEVELVRYPAEAVVLERKEYGDMIGFVEALSAGEYIYSSTLSGFDSLLKEKIRHVGNIAGEIEDLKKESAKLQKAGEKVSAPAGRLKELQEEEGSHRLTVRVASGQEKIVPLRKIVRFHKPNSMGAVEKVFYYMGKVWEFLSTWPRESNTEGGVFPAIFGTVLMVLIMTVTTTPLGVLTAVYLREYARPGMMLNLVRLAVNNLAGVPSIVFGIFGLGFFIYFVGGGIDRFFYADTLPTPTYGTGGILWASLTLALLTVPVVVVATEEGLAAVPIANREGSLALGASKFQTMWNVVLPNAMPGILTGVILAVARGAGEVAPLMITGVVKLVSSLPVDADFPFFHLDRKFMHLGFHIYDVGFQAPNVEAAKPMVYTTTLLLLVMVVVLNLLAITLRNRLRKKYKGAVL